MANFVRRQPRVACMLSAALLSLVQLASSQICPDVPDTSCITVESYNVFRYYAQIAESGSTTVFCKFDLEKTADDKPTWIKSVTDAKFFCEADNECTISGVGSHIKIAGYAAEVTLRGFNFEGASKGAVSIAEDATDFTQTLCNLEFTGNTNKNGGGALKLETNTSALVGNSVFVSNRSKKANGGAISVSSFATVGVFDSVFEENEAVNGGAINVRLNGIADLLNNKFTDNEADEDGEGPAVYLDGLSMDEIYTLAIDGNVFEGNKLDGGNNPCGGDDTLCNRNCNGIYIDNEDACLVDGIRAEATPTLAPVTNKPTNTPTKNPTDEPTRHPTTKSPTTNAPTRHPADSPTTPYPTPAPIPLPTASPTASPTDEPTRRPTPNPTKQPTPVPTPSPTPSPTKSPTPAPTPSPTSSPTKNPTPVPTPSPTNSPTPEPTPSPSARPTNDPSRHPTLQPTPMPVEQLQDLPVPELTYVGESGALGVCEGDCDRDSHCQDNLVCYKREKYDEVPGCSGKGKSGKDYCIVDPDAVENLLDDIDEDIEEDEQIEILPPPKEEEITPPKDDDDGGKETPPQTPEQEDRSCPPLPALSASCIKIVTYKDFRDTLKVAKSGDSLVFCPFEVSKTQFAKTAEIDEAVHIACQIPQQCIFKSGGSHIKVEDRDAEAIIQGFKFWGAPRSAIRFEDDADKHEHKICDCTFESNESRRGGAMAIEEGIEVVVENCDFRNNYASREGGAIYNEGHLTVSHSRFSGNEASKDGGSVFAAKESVLELKGSTFIGNVAREGPDVYNDRADKVKLIDNDGCCSTTMQSGRSDCNGIFKERDEECTQWSDQITI